MHLSIGEDGGRGAARHDVVGVVRQQEVQLDAEFVQEPPLCAAFGPTPRRHAQAALRQPAPNN